MEFVLGVGLWVVGCAMAMCPLVMAARGDAAADHAHRAELLRQPRLRLVARS